MRGAADVPLEQGQKRPQWHYGLLTSLVDFSGLDTAFPFVLAYPQPMLEDLLERRAVELRATVRRGCAVTGLTADGAAEGVGLNVGVQDAMNLGWKLAAVAQGRAGDGLLDSYHAERHPVHARLLTATRAQTALITTFSAEGLALRDVLSGLLGRIPAMGAQLAAELSGLAVAYPPADPGAHELTGRRIPDLPAGDISLFGLLRRQLDEAHQYRADSRQHRSARQQGRRQRLCLRLAVALQRPQEQPVLVAERPVETARMHAELSVEVSNRRALIPPRPEHLHGLVDEVTLIEAARARHIGEHSSS
jgi:hypothetical protein